MGFLFKLILFTLLFAFVVYVLKMIARLTQRVRATVTDVNKLREFMQTAASATGARQTVSAEMVRCAKCGAFVAAKEAVVVSEMKQKQYFCSRECVR